MMMVIYMEREREREKRGEEGEGQEKGGKEAGEGEGEEGRQYTNWVYSREGTSALLFNPSCTNCTCSKVTQY